MTQNILVVHGNNDFLVNRSVRQITQKFPSVVWLDSKDDSLLSIANNPILPPELVVIRNADKLDVEILTKLEPKVLLESNGVIRSNTKIGKFVSSLKKNQVRLCSNSDKSWEVPKEAASFVTEEALAQRVQISPDLASSLVSTVGTDYGYLSFEVLKACEYVKSLGEKEITADTLRKTIATIGELSFEPIRQAFVSRSVKSLMSALVRVKKSNKDPLIPLCAFLEAVIVGSKNANKPTAGLLQIAFAVESGKSADDIAQEFSMNQWRVKSIVIPEIARWNTKDLKKVYEVCASSRRKLVSGSVDPWTYFVASFVAIL